MSWELHDIEAAVRTVRQAIELSGDKLDERLTIEMSGRTARLFLDYLQTMDPDMPRMPICKALGPLVGDTMMNAKLRRLDEIADKLGPLMVRLGMAVRDFERRSDQKL